MAQTYEIILSVVCILFSGLFSGLTLGLLSLDLTDLRVYIDSGTPKEQRYAKRILPIRRRGNYLLVSLLIGNTSVNSALAILSANIFSGIVGFAVSTVIILYLGEIVPQAVCHKYGLIIGAFTSPIVYVLMFITWPIAWPSAKLLNWVLGSEHELRYTKREIKSLVNVHGSTDAPQFSQEETTVLGSAIDFWQKKVLEVMTPLEKVFMLEAHVPLNFDTLTEIFKSGHSRVPVFEERRTNIVGVIFTKDLILLDPDDDILVKTAMTFFNRETQFVFDDTTLGALLSEFKSGRGHLAVVKRVNNTGEGDPFYETVGLVTLEDLIEELIGSEIVDETDVYVDNRRHRRVERKRRFDPEVLKLFDSSARRQETLTPNEQDVVHSFLSRNLREFAPPTISSPVLRRLLRHCEIMECTGEQQLALRAALKNGLNSEEQLTESKLQKSKHFVLYREGEVATEAMLVLQGRLRLVVGKEGFVSEVGPWTMIARHALTQEDYRPDFSAETLELPVRLVKFSQENYQNAKRLSHDQPKGSRSYGLANGTSSLSTSSNLSEVCDDNDGFVGPPTHADLLEKLVTDSNVSIQSEDGGDGAGDLALGNWIQSNGETRIRPIVVADEDVDDLDGVV
eukprot:Plantae.Rhodophyta-Rhodochaete_pulchella.ctg3968.p1 GENE.Plantae.Rhodophyta-Rhodochaete_pulchella.ctg3968~~Plantae.Rhodophyta-Rhodochaete_pulchella.ctg3968.p1  ORF type:complete len:623 (+),score=112.75 Plantae.Rhodophyta-Rhodochaete_pulchella.ctg3968:259-2127(+)